jgi:23S rRNA pseudouridine1911/1915/1917 synthase
MSGVRYEFVAASCMHDASLTAAKVRLDQFVLAQPEITLSRSQVRNLILAQAITVNGQPEKPGYWVKPHDIIGVIVPEPRPADLVAEAIPLDILYEDDAVLVLNKPAGMVVHPAPGHGAGTLVHALLHHCPNLSGIGGVQRPGIIHRLDRDTSGLLLVAKTDAAHQQLSAQLSRRELTRIYYAIAHGRFNTLTGFIDAPIGRHPGDRKKMAVVAEHGREAVTIFHIVEQYAEHALLQLQLKTGRTHQIRVHLKHIQHPVVGDPVYGTPTKNNLNLTRQALHAAEIKFTHPVTGQLMTFAIPLPVDLQSVVERLRAQNRRT